MILLVADFLGNEETVKTALNYGMLGIIGMVFLFSSMAMQKSYKDMLNKIIDDNAKKQDEKFKEIKDSLDTLKKIIGNNQASLNKKTAEILKEIRDQTDDIEDIIKDK